MRARLLAAAAMLGCVALVTAGWGLASGLWPSARGNDSRGTSEAPSTGVPGATGLHRATLFDMPPLRNPAAATVAETDLPDDEVVLGVVHAGRAMAYQRAALAEVASHVVHSDIGLQSIVVTHCPRNSCTRVFLAEPSKSPEMRLGGWREDQTMDLIVGTERFSQQARDIPLAELPHVEATWGQWKRRHPETLIYRLP